MKYFLFLLICLCTLPTWADWAKAPISPSQEQIQDCINAFSEQKIFLIIPSIILLTFSLLLLFLSKKKKHNLVYSITLCFFSILLFCSSFLRTPQIQACLGYEDCEIEVAKNSHQLHSWCEEMMDKYYLHTFGCSECGGIFVKSDDEIQACDECLKAHWQYDVFRNIGR